jgi:hypothetical protein
VLAILRQSFLITDGVRKANVGWRPAIEIPLPSDFYTKEKFVSAKWRHYQENQLCGYERMVGDLLKTHLQTGMTSEEVDRLLGKPDTSYEGESLGEFGSNLPAGTARCGNGRLDAIGG